MIHKLKKLVIRCMALIVILGVVSCTAISRKGSKGAAASNTATPIKTLTAIQQKALLRKQMRSVFLRDVTVKGRTVDEHGNSVKGVRMYQYVFNKLGEHRYQDILEGGTFEVTHEQCLGVYLVFHKPGYFKREYRFVPKSDFNHVDLDNGRTMILEENFNALLETVGPETKMEEYTLELEFNVDKPLKGVILKPNENYEKEIKRGSKVNHFIPIQATVENGKIPPGCLYFRLPVTPQKTIRTLIDGIFVENPSGSGWYGEGVAPTQISIGLSGNDYGLIKYQSKKDYPPDCTPIRTLQEREMKNAPESGYVHEVEFIPSPLSMHHFAFIKYGDYYGRIHIGMEWRVDKKTKKSMKLRVNLSLQPDGSRNIRSMKGASSPMSDDPKKTSIDFDVSGQVSDKAGKPIQGVIAQVNAGKEKWSREVADSFAFRGKGESFYIDFRKPGYYPTRITVNQLYKDKIQENKGGKRSLRVKDLKVVMESMGEILPMESMVCPVIFSTTEKSRSFALVKDGKFSSQIVDFNFPKNTADIPDLQLYVTSKVDDGKIATLTETVRHPTVVLPAGRAPSTLHLCLNGTGCGFIRYNPSDKKKWIRWRDLKEAPADGYQSTLFLDPKLGEHYFYIKCGDFYGKGHCKSVREVKRDGTWVQPFVKLYMQPNKSRNVRTPF
ncbi:hypothetical protein BVX99_00315 [bacterium F16]|nr:hypothetical protein BVX99_00315 [bacterium F16]